MINNNLLVFLLALKELHKEGDITKETYIYNLKRIIQKSGHNITNNTNNIKNIYEQSKNNIIRDKIK